MIERGATVTTNNEFMGLISCTLESSFDFLDEGSEADSDPESSDEVTKCHMVQHVPVRDGAKPAIPVANAPRNLAVAVTRSAPLPNIAQERLQARRQELEEVHRQLAAEESAINYELEWLVQGDVLR